MASKKKPTTIGFSCGDPNGIGAEILVKVFQDNRMFREATPVFYGAPNLIEAAIEKAAAEAIASAINNAEAFELLGADSETSPAELKKKYRKLAIKYHPDKNPSAGAVDEFQKITTAYHFLTDKECAKLIALMTRRGYETALINVGMVRHVRDTSTRRSGRCIIDSPAFADELWRRLRLHLRHRSSGTGRSR